MKINKILCGMALGMASLSAHAVAVYWEPTDGNVNFTYTTVAGYSLGIFDVDDFDGSQANPLMLNTGAGADTINIVAAGSNFSATSTVTNSSTTLYNDSQFVIALTDNTDWFEPVSWYELASGSNLYDITFSNGSVLSIDATPTVVPIPAAVWLFGSGLIGLLGFARRKKA